MKRLATVLGIASILFVACGTTASVVSPSPTVSSGPTPTLTEDQMIVAAVGARFRSNFYSSRADCVQAVDDGTTKQCVFPTGMERIAKPEWEQLFPDTVFYLVDISGWRSTEELLAHESQNSGPRRHLVAWHNVWPEISGTILTATARPPATPETKSACHPLGYLRRHVQA